MNALKCANWFWSDDVKPPSESWLTMLTAPKSEAPEGSEPRKRRTPSPTLRNFLWGDPAKVPAT